jgi:hypothetical protein
MNHGTACCCCRMRAMAVRAVAGAGSCARTHFRDDRLPGERFGGFRARTGRVPLVSAPAAIPTHHATPETR